MERVVKLCALCAAKTLQSTAVHFCMLGSKGTNESGLPVAATGSSFCTSVYNDLSIYSLLKEGKLNIAIKMEALPWDCPYFNRDGCVKVENILV